MNRLLLPLLLAPGLNDRGRSGSCGSRQRSRTRRRRSSDASGSSDALGSSVALSSDAQLMAVGAVYRMDTR